MRSACLSGARRATLPAETRPPWPTPRPTHAEPSIASAARSSTCRGTDDASKQALADASERFNAAGSQIDQATTAKQALLAKESAIEGLYYVRAARTAMGMDPGPELETLSGQKSAGTVTEDRRVEFEGREIEASPNPTERTPNYYPGGRVAGRPVPAGWYSEPWWKPALVAGAWGVGSVFLFSALFSGMGGVGYDAQGFESGQGDGTATAATPDGDGGGDYGDGGGDMGRRRRRLGRRQLGRWRQRRLGWRRLRRRRFRWRLRRLLKPSAAQPKSEAALQAR